MFNFRSNKVRNIIVCVDDPKKHNVCFSRIAQAWLLENYDDGLVSQHNSFGEAIAAMQQATGLDGSGYEWWIAGNPYYRGD